MFLTPDKVNELKDAAIKKHGATWLHTFAQDLEEALLKHYGIDATGAQQQTGIAAVIQALAKASLDVNPDRRRNLRDKRDRKMPWNRARFITNLVVETAGKHGEHLEAWHILAAATIVAKKAGHEVH